MRRRRRLLTDGPPSRRFFHHLRIRQALLRPWRIPPRPFGSHYTAAAHPRPRVRHRGARLVRHHHTRRGDQAERANAAGLIGKGFRVPGLHLDGSAADDTAQRGGCLAAYVVGVHGAVGAEPPHDGDTVPAVRVSPGSAVEMEGRKPKQGESGPGAAAHDRKRWRRRGAARHHPRTSRHIGWHVARDWSVNGVERRVVGCSRSVSYDTDRRGQNENDAYRWRRWWVRYSCAGSRERWGTAATTYGQRRNRSGNIQGARNTGSVPRRRATGDVDGSGKRSVFGFI